MSEGQPTYKLIYFNARGRAEHIRYIFAYAGVDYVDERIPKERWPELKKCKCAKSIFRLSFNSQILLPLAPTFSRTTLFSRAMVQVWNKFHFVLNVEFSPFHVFPYSFHYARVFASQSINLPSINRKTFTNFLEKDAPKLL